MAISPPSDLVLDVSMAANPETMRAAAEKLRGMTPGVAAAKGPSREDFASLKAAGATEATPAEAVASHMKAYKKFEAFMLQSFVETMFTGDNEAVFGQGIAGDYWKSMMAEAIANKMADAGGVGIARMLEQQAGKAKSEATEASDAIRPDDPVRFTPRASNVILYQIERQLIHRQLDATESVDDRRQG